MLEHVVVARHQLRITTAATGNGTGRQIKIAWNDDMAKDITAALESASAPENARNEGLIQSIIRAHAWIQTLRDGAHKSIEQLAEANDLHPKVVRQNLRLAFLSPDIVSAILEGRQPPNFSLRRIPKLLSFRWAEHRLLLG
jgi:site-specific DNA recombinase